MSDLLRVLWERIDVDDPIIDGDEASLLPGGVLARLEGAGLVREIERAQSIVCDACERGHVEEVTFIESPPGSGVRAYVGCPDAGRVRVPLERLRQWRIDFAGLARGIAGALSLAGDVDEIVPGRLWLLGKASLAGTSRELFLVRGMLWRDARDVVASAPRFLASRNAVALLAGRVPNESAWRAAPPTVVPLDALLSLDGGGIAVDRRHLDASFGDTPRPVTPGAIQSFPTPAGVRWEDLRITLTEHELTAELLGVTRHLSFADAGFEDRRRGRVPDRLWRLLRRLAVAGGVLRQPLDLEKREVDSLRTSIVMLRKRLRALFQLEADPIPFVDGSYRCVFKLAATDGVQFPTPAGARWFEVSICEAYGGVIQISVAGTEQYSATSPSGGGDGRWGARVVAVRTEEVQESYDLRQLGMVDDQDEPDECGRALLEVLRQHGRVARDMSDEAMLKLGSALTQVMLIDGAPFNFDTARGLWIAEFSASSAVATPASR